MVGRRAKRATEEVHSCSSMVYCQGDLLDTVQKQELYADSKTFVDMSQRNDESVTLANFQAMMASTNNTPSKDDVQKFVDDNFVFENETESWTPPDFNENPAFLEKISDPNIRNFAKSLVSFWPQLGRKIRSSVNNNPTRHSLIPVPEGFIVPGGRFREIYYWDSYWIIKGLLISEMHETVKGMLTNLIYLIKQYGLIPNGSRVYYINRSQPPLFASMVGLYLDYTNDLDWLRANIEYIETELNFWLSSRTLNLTSNGVSYMLAHYGTESNTPRPESYSEDIATCAHETSETARRGCYNALKTAAETGWDFSTRWIFDEQGGTNATLSSIDSKRVIPVDLNAFLCKSFGLLADFYGKIGNVSKQNLWANRALEWRNSIETLLYNDADGIWYDFDYDMKVQRQYFFASNFAPLWAECYREENKEQYGSKAVKYFRKSEIELFQGGIPTSLEESGEQWDLPNAWPPLQEFVVLGLHKSGDSEAQSVAKEFANRWISANMKGFETDGAMYEKYDAIYPGQYGGGGEYEVQLGFGWSNGVALAFIDQFSSSSKIKALMSKSLYFAMFSSLSLYFTYYKL
ncbi:hypothetical protein D910_09163 [Dendroctonus ponderosae]|uniref:Trehalase n=2 Tax=Dendroctonus ponderosae TaxID=77166 RepID=U4UHM7_DENPD|nr:hypothetical protein D910_09163 [Dendroctonus ponderosae]